MLIKFGINDVCKRSYDVDCIKMLSNGKSFMCERYMNKGELPKEVTFNDEFKCSKWSPQLISNLHEFLGPWITDPSKRVVDEQGMVDTVYMLIPEGTSYEVVFEVMEAIVFLGIGMHLLSNYYHLEFNDEASLSWKLQMNAVGNACIIFSNPVLTNQFHIHLNRVYKKEMVLIMFIELTHKVILSSMPATNFTMIINPTQESQVALVNTGCCKVSKRLGCETDMEFQLLNSFIAGYLDLSTEDKINTCAKVSKLIGITVTNHFQIFQRSNWTWAFHVGSDPVLGLQNHVYVF